MKLWLLRWLWRSLLSSGILESIASTNQIEDVRSNLSTLALSFQNLRAEVQALKRGEPSATPDLAPALHQLVAYIVIAAYQGSDQTEVMAAIEEVWGPIKEHLVASGVLAKEGGDG